MKNESENDLTYENLDISDIKNINNRLNEIELNVAFLFEYYGNNIDELSKKSDENTSLSGDLWSLFKFGLSIEILVLILVLILKVLFSLV